MMRTVEVLFVIMILVTSFTIATQFAILPSAREAFGTELGELAQSTLEMLDAEGVLSATVFSDSADSWGDLQKALSASLPVNTVYNLTVYDFSESSEGVTTYHLSNSVSDSSFGADSDSASLLVASPDVTYSKEVEPIKDETTGKNLTLYILNCTDARGWWITGFTGQTLAAEFKSLLSPYFTTTVLVNSTTQLDDLLNNNTLTADPNECVQNAVVVNTFGEAVPISVANAGFYSTDYADYFYYLGQKVNAYNWNWVSIVGYPFYYVSNVDYFLGIYDQNDFGIYGVRKVAEAGAIAFLDGFTNELQSNLSTPIKVELYEPVTLSSNATFFCDTYGIYPNPTQTASRALKNATMEGTYDLIPFELFTRADSDPSCIPAAIYKSDVDASGLFTAIGLARIPDVRVAILGLLMYYHPPIYRSNFGDSGTSRLVTLQLGQQGGS